MRSPLPRAAAATAKSDKVAAAAAVISNKLTGFEMVMLGGSAAVNARLAAGESIVSIEAEGRSRTVAAGAVNSAPITLSTQALPFFHF
jgi:hypothetical protein